MMAVIALRSLFFALGCLMVALLIYTIATDGLPFRTDLLTPWMAATLVDYYINVVPLAAWVFYKEANILKGILWIILLICLGSVTTSFYILLQFLKRPAQESFQDSMYNVLIGGSGKASMEHKGKHSPVTIARVVFIALGCVMIGTLLYTLSTDGSPFRKGILTPWLTATLVDFYINVTALAVWVVYKESSWFSALLWIILLIGLGSISTCLYIVYNLCQLTTHDPLYMVLLKNDDIAENRYERTLL